MLNLATAEKSRTKHARSYVAAIPWLALLRPGIMLNKDGSLMACFEFDGPDIDSIGSNEMDAVSDMLEHAMKPMDERFTLWWTMRRRRSAKYPDADFRDNEAAARINSMHRDSFMRGSLFENKHYLSIVFTPFSGVEGFFDRVAMHLREDGVSTIGAIMRSTKESLIMRNRFQFDEKQINDAIEQFENVVTEFAGTMASVSFKQLVHTDLLGFLHACVNPWVGEPRKVNLPRTMMIDGYLPEAEVATGRESMIFWQSDGEHAVSAISVKDFPDSSRPGIMDILLSIDGEVTVSMVFRFLAQEKSASFIDKRRRHYLLTQKTMMQYIKDSVFKTDSEPDPGKAAMAEEASIALGDITEKNVRYGFFNFTVLAHGRSVDEADETTRLVMAAVNQTGFVALRERVGLQSAFSGTLPGQWGEIFRWHFVTVANLADMALLRTLNGGERTNKHLTEQSGTLQPANAIFHTMYNTPYYFNFHNGDLGHFMVIGPAGSGKSVIMNLLIALYQKHDPITVIFDKDYSCRIPTILQGGGHIDIDSRDVHLNPISMIGDKKHWPFLAKFLEVLLTYRGRELSSGDDKRIQQAIEAVHNMSPSLWRLSSVRSQLPSDLGSELDVWVDNGRLARFFDNEKDDFNLGGFTCMEMGGLMLRYPEAAVAFMEYAFYRIDLMLGKGRPALIYVEEAWFMMGNPFFARRLDDWLRTLRKKNAIVGMATQSLAEIGKSDFFASIVDNTPTRFFLPNREALAHLDTYVEKFSLTEEEVRLKIVSAIQKRNYYLVNRSLKRMLDVPMEKELLACLRSDVRARAVFDKHYDHRESNANWKWDYIREISQ